MTLDASIPLRVNSAPRTSARENLLLGLQLKNNKASIEQARESAAREEYYRNRQDQRAEQKHRSEMTDADMERGMQNLERGAMLLSTVTDDASYANAIEQFKEMELGVPKTAPATYDPEWVEAQVNRAIPIVEQWKAKRQDSHRADDRAYDEQWKERNYALDERRTAAAELKANQPNVLINQGNQEKEESKAYGKSLVSEYDGIRERSDMAQQELQQLNILRGIDVSTGALEPAKAFVGGLAESLGFDPQKLNLGNVDNAQAFIGVAENLVLTKMQAQKGPQTEGDAKRIKATVARLGNTPAAKDFLISAAAAIKEREVEQDRFYQEWRADKGSFDGARSEWTHYLKKTPLLGENPKTGRPLFLNDFRREVLKVNPDATETDVLTLWRNKYGRAR